MFKNIPKKDLEMLFPNTKVKIKLFDKIKIAILGGGGTVGGAMSMVTKLSASIEPTTALVSIGGFLGVLWRQPLKMFLQKEITI